MNTMQTSDAPVPKRIRLPLPVSGHSHQPTYDQLLETKAYIDERSRREWREQYGEFHEEYVTVQTQVTVDDNGDVWLVMPRYHPPGCASSSTYSGKIPPTELPKAGLDPADHFHCVLIQSIREEALQRGDETEKMFDIQLWYLFHNAVAKGSDPEHKKQGHTPASLYGCSKKNYYLARDVFSDRIKAFQDPYHFKDGLWGFGPKEVGIVRGIIFVRYITGWWERDSREHQRREKNAERG